MEGDEQCGSAHSKRPKCEWQPPVWRRVVCRSQQTSSRQHKNSLLSGVIGAFRLHSDPQRTQCQVHTMFMSFWQWHWNCRYCD